MRIRTIHLVILFLGLIFSVKVSGQIYSNDESKIFNPLTDDITKRLPNIRVLIDSAVANSPSVRYEEVKADYYYYEQLTQERYWMEHFSFNLDWNWGVWNFHDTQTSAIANPKTFRIDLNSIRDNFAVGFYIRFPLASIVDRRNRIAKQKNGKNYLLFNAKSTVSSLCSRSLQLTI